MYRSLLLVFAVFTATAFVGAELAEARRLGGGRSFGMQRQMTPPPGVAKAAPGAAAPAAASAAGRTGASRWMGPIAGLAAGLGLAALMAHLGLSEAFGSFLLIALFVLGGIFLLRMLTRRSAPPSRPLQYAGAGAGMGAPAATAPASGERSAFEPVFGGTLAAAPVAAAFPPGFDPAPFIEQGKVQFRKLQAAYDRADRNALAEVMTPELLAEVTQDLAQRGTHTPTEVMSLDAQVLNAATEGDRHWISIRFTGMLREDGAVLPKAFDETWNLTKPVTGGSGWLLAGIQQADG